MVNSFWVSFHFIRRQIQMFFCGSQVGGSGVLVSNLTYIFEEETPRWRCLLSQLGLWSSALAGLPGRGRRQVWPLWTPPRVNFRAAAVAFFLPQNKMSPPLPCLISVLVEVAWASNWAQYWAFNGLVFLVIEVLIRIALYAKLRSFSLVNLLHLTFVTARRPRSANCRSLQILNVGRRSTGNGSLRTHRGGRCMACTCSPDRFTCGEVTFLGKLHRYLLHWRRWWPEDESRCGSVA